MCSLSPRPSPLEHLPDSSTRAVRDEYGVVDSGFVPWGMVHPLTQLREWWEEGTRYNGIEHDGAGLLSLIASQTKSNSIVLMGTIGAPWSSPDADMARALLY